MVFELLEQRLAPAGLISVILAGGVLKITGDGSRNLVEISGGDDNTFTVTALADTMLSVDGEQVASYSFDNVTKGLAIDLKGGDDYLSLSGVTVQAGNVSALLGDGNNNLNIAGLDVTGNFSVTGLKGNDAIGANGGTIHVTGLTAINLGDGINTTSLLGVGGSSFDKAFSYTGGTGSDDVSITGNNLQFGGNVDFKVGAGGGAVIIGQGPDDDYSTLVVKGNLGFTALDHLTKSSSINLASTDVTITGGVTIKHGAGDNKTDVSANRLTVGGDVSVTNGNSNLTNEEGGFTHFTATSVAQFGGDISVTNGSGLLWTQISSQDDLYVAGKVAITNGNGPNNGLTSLTTIRGQDVQIGESLTVINKTGNYVTQLNGGEISIGGAIAFSTVANVGNNSGNNIYAAVSLQADSISILNGAGGFDNTISAGEVNPEAGRGHVTGGPPPVVTQYTGEISINKGIVIKNGNNSLLDTTSRNNIHGHVKIAGGIAITNGNGSFENLIGSNYATETLDIGKDITITNGVTQDVTNKVRADQATIGGSILIKNGARTYLSNEVNVDDLSVRGAVSFGNGATDSDSFANNNIGVGVRGNVGSLAITNGNGGFENRIGAKNLSVTGALTITNGNGNYANNSIQTWGDSHFGSITLKSGNNPGSNTIVGDDRLDIAGNVTISNGTNSGMALYTSILSNDIRIGGAVNISGTGGNSNTTIQGLGGSGRLDIGGPINVTQGAGSDVLVIGAYMSSVNINGGITAKLGVGATNTSIGGDTKLNVNGSISVTSLAGNDEVSIRGAGRVTGGITTAFGEGDTAKAVIGGGNGNLVVTGAVSMTAGAATARNIELIAGTFNGFNFVGGSGEDQVYLSLVTMQGATKLDLLGGNDTASIYSSNFRGALTILGGAGADTVNLENFSMSFAPSNFHGAVSVNLGSGTDVLNVANSYSPAYFYSTVSYVGGGADAETVDTLNTNPSQARYIFEPTLSGLTVNPEA